MKDKPFALIGVNADGQNLAKIEKFQGISWRNFSDSGTDGPIYSDCNVFSIPVYLLLDGKGTVRFSCTGPEFLTEKFYKAIETLLAEAGHEVSLEMTTIGTVPSEFVDKEN